MTDRSLEHYLVHEFGLEIARRCGLPTHIEPTATLIGYRLYVRGVRCFCWYSEGRFILTTSYSRIKLDATDPAVFDLGAAFLQRITLEPVL